MSRSVDEYLHAPGEDPLWSESHYFDFVGDTLQGHARLGFYPNVECSSVWLYLHVDGEEPLGLHDEAVPPARIHGTTVRGAGWRFEYRPTDWTSRWECHFHGELVRVGPDGFEAGEDAVPVELRLGLVGRTDPFFYSQGHGFGEVEEDPRPDGADRYEQPVRVEGWVELNGERYSVGAPGERDHSWGPRDWFGMNWCWCSGSFEDGTAFNLTRLLGIPYRNGFWFDGTRTRPLTTVTLRAEPALGPKTARTWSRGERDVKFHLEMGWADGGTAVEVDPFASTPIRWRPSQKGTPEFVSDVEAARLLFTRSACRMEREGVAGRGYLEYGQGIDRTEAGG